MFSIVKERCGIPEEIKIYDDDIRTYLGDCLEDMKSSGVPERFLAEKESNPQTITAATLYVKAYLEEDCTETEKYLDLYRKKVFRLTMEDG